MTNKGLAIYLIYIIALVIITCYMMVNYSGWFVLLLLLTDLDIGEGKSE